MDIKKDFRDFSVKTPWKQRPCDRSIYGSFFSDEPYTVHYGRKKAERSPNGCFFQTDDGPHYFPGNRN